MSRGKGGGTAAEKEGEKGGKDANKEAGVPGSKDMREGEARGRGRRWGYRSRKVGGGEQQGKRGGGRGGGGEI